MGPGSRKSSAGTTANGDRRFAHHTRCIETETFGPFLMV
jgi:hypothetical protein